MRLIDADAITKDSEAVTAFCGLFKKCGMKHTSACLAPTCEDCVARFFKNYEHLIPTIDAVKKTELIEDLKHEKDLFQLKSFTGTELKAINGVFNHIIEMLTELY